MKKIIALILAAMIVCALPAMAFAADSPSGAKTFSITVQKADVEGTDKTQITVNEGGTVTAKVDKEVGTFNNWKIYKVVDSGASQLTVGELSAAAKYVEAVANTDYVLVTGTLKDTTITVKPLTDIVICANYNNKITDPMTGNMTQNAPQTGSNVALLVFIGAVALAGVAVVTKKVVA